MGWKDVETSKDDLTFNKNNQQDDQTEGKPKVRCYLRDVDDTEILSKIRSTVCISPIYHFQTSCKLISSKAWLNPVLSMKFFNYIEYNSNFDDFNAAIKEAGINVQTLKKEKKTFHDLNQAII